MDKNQTFEALHIDHDRVAEADALEAEVRALKTRVRIFRRTVEIIQVETVFDEIAEVANDRAAANLQNVG